MKKAGLYLRVSTEMQVEKDSLPTQEKLLKRFCSANDYKVQKIYREAGESAKNTARPKLDELKQDAIDGMLDAVVVLRLDRITRSNRDLWSLVEFFEAHSVEFISMTENFDTRGPVGRFMLNMLASLAQMERETIAHRVAEAMYSRADDGKWNGGVIPYGYTTQARIAAEHKKAGKPPKDAIAAATKLCPVPRILYIDKDEAELLRRIFDHYLETRSLRNTVRWLNANGYRTRRGKLWASSTVHRLLSSNIYLGRISYGKRTHDLNTGKLKKNKKTKIMNGNGHQPALVDKETFDKAQEILAEKAGKPRSSPRTYLLSGAHVLRCGKCGGAMYGYTQRKKGEKKEYFYYRCHHHISIGNEACEGLSIPGHSLDNFVIETLKNLSHDCQFLADKRKMLAAMKKKANTRRRGKDSDLSRLRTEEAKTEARIDTLLEKLETRVIDDTTFKQRHQELRHRLEQNRLAQAETECSEKRLDVQEASMRASFDQIASFEKNWDALDDAGRAGLLRTVVKRITATRKKVRMEIYLDPVDKVSHTGTGSSRPPA